MKQKPKHMSLNKTVSFTAIVYVFAVAGIMLVINACKKGAMPEGLTSDIVNSVSADANGNTTMTRLMNVAHIRKADDGVTDEVMFYESERIYKLNDVKQLVALQSALNNNTSLKVTADMDHAVVERISEPTTAEINTYKPVDAIYSPGSGYVFNTNKLDEKVDEPEMIGIPNNTGGLTGIIPDLATAQVIFDYFMQQSCNLPGPFGIDQCISFQYTEDGCYARAHKMRWILENRYHYRVQKVFSFANNGTDHLGVTANKWGGCCITWWYHVAPLVTIRTPSGPKSYVMDPAMFNTPVPLSTWLGAQQDKRCSSTAHVSMYNIQSADKYEPTSYSGLVFNTDPAYSMTNGTLTSYSHLKSCP